MQAYLRGRLKSFAHAFAGGVHLLATQPNARIHAFASVVIVLLGYLFNLRPLEWLFILSAITLVWITETLNTAIECLGDAISQDPHHYIKAAKDLGAFATLIAALFAVVVGSTIFIPYMV